MKPVKAAVKRSRCLSGSGPGGFTLIEVLIALSVLGVTLTSVFTLFSAGMKLRSATRDRLAFDRDTRLVVGALMNDFSNLVPSGPAPLVSADSIVLWRQRSELSETGAVVRTIPELVTYQWSGSGFQDSMLVRVATTLAVDVSDSGAVHAEFLKWARVDLGPDVSVKNFLREGEDTRFGARAVLNELAGSWLGYPTIRGFAFGIAGNPDEEGEDEETQSRILVRLSPREMESSVPWREPLRGLEMMNTPGSAVDAGFWLPVKAKKPLAREEDPSGEERP